MATYIHGIGASENIDSSGERLIIAGMDISSLEVDGVFNFEHKSDTPDQIVGKILKAKKIFSDKDCEDDHQKYFWEKCKTPYVYVMGELFDDYKDSAKDIAGMFRYDNDKKNQNERNVMNFSIEGAKIHKEGIDVTRSIARKVTITVLPCNKAAVAEMIVVQQKPKDDLDSLFKTEGVEIELFKSDGGAGVPGASGLALSEKTMVKAVPPKLSVAGPKGTKIGTTSSGKDVHSHGRIHEYQGFNEQDHKEAAGFHQRASDASKSPSMKQWHHDRAALHNQASNSLFQQGLKTKERQAKLAMTPGPSTPKTNRQNDKLFHPERSGTMPPPGPVKKHEMELIQKALDAGSGLAAPSNLTQGAALAKESLDGKIKPTGTTEAFHEKGKNTPVGQMLRRKDLKDFKKQPKPNLPKSEMLQRAEQEYQSWGKREQFESFMKSRMPHLTKGEIIALGQTMMLHKSIKKEKVLKNLMDGAKKVKKGICLG